MINVIFSWLFHQFPAVCTLCIREMFADLVSACRLISWKKWWCTEETKVYCIALISWMCRCPVNLICLVATTLCEVLSTLVTVTLPYLLWIFIVLLCAEYERIRGRRGHGPHFFTYGVGCKTYPRFSAAFCTSSSAMAERRLLRFRLTSNFICKITKLHVWATLWGHQWQH